MINCGRAFRPMRNTPGLPARPFPREFCPKGRHGFVIALGLTVYLAVAAHGTTDHEAMFQKATPTDALRNAIDATSVNDTLDRLPVWRRTKMLEPVVAFVSGRTSDPVADIEQSWLLAWREFRKGDLSVREAFVMAQYRRGNKPGCLLAIVYNNDDSLPWAVTEMLGYPSGNHVAIVDLGEGRPRLTFVNSSKACGALAIKNYYRTSRARMVDVSQYGAGKHVEVLVW